MRLEAVSIVSEEKQASTAYCYFGHILQNSG